MNKAEAKKRIEKLKKVINYHRYLYHVLDKQEISDAALDSLKHELVEIEELFPDLRTKDSPSQRVGGKPLTKFEKVEHKTQMLSIEDVFHRDEVKKWQEYLKRLAPDTELDYFCELKIDGFAISLIYKKGILVQAATRGDGRIGEDVTQNVKTIESIPLKINILKDIQDKEVKKNIEQLILSGRIEIRGEVYMEKKSFEDINAQRIKQGESQYANPRNLAAGSIRQLNPKLAGSRDLKFLAYDIPSDIASDIGINNHSDKHIVLSAIGFKAEKGKICNSLQKIENFWQSAAEKRENLPYQVDGVVITVNNNNLFYKLGIAGKSPRGVRAWKFAAKQATSIIEDIKIQIGRTGTATPVAILRPVNIGGAAITRATLHNNDQIGRLGVKKGDTVIVERAGDVIPAVIKVLKDLRTGREKTFHFPESCPVCGAKLVNIKGEVARRCPNSDCPARKTEFLEHFISKKAFNIEGLGPKILAQLVDQGLISGPADLFDLEKGDLLPLERFGEKSAANLIQEIEKSKEISLDRFVFALGIRHVGEETARDLAGYFGNLEKLKNASIEELSVLPDVGDKVSESVFSWFNKSKNLKLISELKSKGVKIISPKRVVVSAKLKGKSFVFTGFLETMSRDEAYKLVRRNGGIALNSLSKKTDFLVLGKEPGSKVKKARKLSVAVINEQDFLKMIE